MTQAHDHQIYARALPTPADHTEMLQQLVLRREPLISSEVALLKKVYREIITSQHPTVWDQVRRRGLQDHEAKDLVQEIFISLYNDLVAQGFVEELSEMLETITRRVLWAHVRRRSRTPDFVPVPSSRSQTPGSGPGVESEAHMRLVARALFSQLSPQHQSVIELVLWNRMSHPEAALKLGLPEGTLKSRLLAAKDKLLELALQFAPLSQKKPSQ